MRNKKETSTLLPDHSDLILKQIMKDLNLDYEKECTYSYRSRVFGTYLLRKALLLLAVCLVVFLFIPSTITPIDVTNISAPNTLDGSFTRVGFEVTSHLLIRKVTAKLNDHILPVIHEGHYYYVDVNENGSLVLETVSVTGIHSSHHIMIEGIDDQAPSVVRHSRKGDLVLVYLTDGDGTGVDYEGIFGYAPDSTLQVAPSFYDEEKGYVAFPYPSARIYINIPDRGGNKLTIFLEPQEP